MKLTYLGTAAAEAWPAIFCHCDNCKRAQKAGGRNIRTRSQAVVNDDLLIDFPADSYLHFLQTGIDFSALRYCIVTHSHSDHFTPNELYYRYEGAFAHGLTVPEMDLYGNEAVLALYAKVPETHPSVKITPHLVTAYEPFTVGRYEIIPLAANHAPKEKPVVYCIRDGEKTLLYLHDTGLPEEAFFDYLRSHGIRADLVSFDCTYGATPGVGGHLGLDTVQVLRDRLREIGTVDDATVCVVNHFSHNGNLTYDEMVPVARELGFETSYDGMEIEF